MEHRASVNPHQLVLFCARTLVSFHVNPTPFNSLFFSKSEKVFLPFLISVGFTPKLI